MSQFYVQQLASDDEATLGAFDWQNLIGQGFDFGKTFLADKYGKDAAKAQAAAAPAVAAATTAATTASSSSAVTAAADSSGFHIGQTFIPWSYVIVGGLGFFLLQSSGFTRRK
jgi:hypothetical protein